MAVVKSLLILVSALAQQYAATPPNVRPPTEQLREQHGLERLIPHSATPAKALSLIWALFDIALLLALSDRCPPALARPIRDALPRALTTTPAPAALTPAFLAGTCLTLAGAALRAHCFRALGPRFTFELAIRPAHALATGGAYGVVRHPSYTGVVALVLGGLLCVHDRRHWLVGVCTSQGLDDGRCGAVVAGALACVWATSLGSMYVALSTRMDKEDAMLEKNFGEAWRAWAKRVPWRLVPGVC